MKKQVIKPSFYFQRTHTHNWRFYLGKTEGEFNGKKHSFSDQWGERMWLSEPERYECQNIFEQYEGRELSEVIAEGHGVRSDGFTLIAQPHTSKDGKLWTLDDIKKIGCVFADPLKAL